MCYLLCYADELDSYMYQTVGHQGVELYSEALDLPLFRQHTQGKAVIQDNLYTMTPKDEVEDLYQLLCNVKVRLTTNSFVAIGQHFYFQLYNFKKEVA